jgi:hypothetical protein
MMTLEMYDVFILLLAANPELVEDGEEFIVDELVTSEAKYVNSGEGTTPPVKGDADLESECGEARDSGTQSEASASVYQVVATHTYAGPFSITEAGIHTHLSAGVLFIRGTFAVISVAASDQIEFTFTLEIQ